MLKKGNAKDCSTYCTIALISHASKVMLKILQARLQQFVYRELPDVQADFRKGRETRNQIANIHWFIKKAREFQKSIYFCFIDYAKAFDSVNGNIKAAQSRLTLWDPMDYTIHGILQARTQLFHSPGDLPNPAIEPMSPILQADSLPAEPPLCRSQQTVENSSRDWNTWPP